jgi:hypothetical protein
MDFGTGGRRRAPQALGQVVWALLLPALWGCGGAEGEYESIIESRSGARETLAALGAKISQKKFPIVGKVLLVDLSGARNISDGTFALLKQAGTLIGDLDLSESNVTDEHMALLNEKDLSGSLAKLNLSDTRISDEGLARLTLLGFLSELNLTNTKVTDDGVKAFLEARANNPAVTNKRPRIRR